MQTLYTAARTLSPQVYSTILFTILLVLIAGYMYLVGMSVVHVVMGKEVQQKSVAVQSEITELETAYITAQHSVREEVALQRGFTPRQEKVYIAASEAAVVVSREQR